MEKLQQFIPLLIPIAVIELGLMIAALVDVIRSPRVRGPKWAWILVVVLINFIGPIIYFIFGRKEE